MVQNLKGFSVKQLTIVSFAMIMLLSSSIGNIRSAYAEDGVGGMIVENIVASLDCDTAAFHMACTIASANMSLVHFPSPVNMNDAHLANCTSIIVVFTETTTVLTFMFNETSEGDARTNADAMLLSMNTAFNSTFAHNSTITFSYPYQFVSVNYVADAKADIQTFLANLETDCIDSTVDGFSEVLPSFFTRAESKTIILTATNASSTWYNMLVAEYDTSFPLGSGEHTIDILYYLGTGSLRPSEYTNVGMYYTSYVSLTINSSSTVTFVSCQPDEAAFPLVSAGWYVPIKEPANEISGTMYFGNTPNIGEVITFTFQGTVIPEFTALTSILTIMLIYTILLHLRRHRKTIL